MGLLKPVTLTPHVATKQVISLQLRSHEEESTPFFQFVGNF